MDDEEESDTTLLNRLDWKSHEILQALADCGGTATTTEIRKQSAIDKNDHITHRYRRASVALEPHGLIEVQDPEPSASQRNLPLQVTLTEKGAALAERLTERRQESRSYTLEERLEAVEGTLTTLEATLGTSAPEPDTDEATVTARLAAVEQRLETLEDALASEYGGWSAETQAEYQVFANGTRAIRDFLRDEYGPSFKQHVDDYLENNDSSR